MTVHNVLFEILQSANGALFRMTTWLCIRPRNNFPLCKKTGLGANPNDRHEAASEARLFAMAEEVVGVAGSAEAAGEDVMRAQPGSEKLRAIGLGQIEMNIARRWLVARRRHVEPLQRIGFVTGARFIEIFRGIGELRGELGKEVRSDFVAACADGRADRGEQVGRHAAKFQAHPANRFFGDAGERALPTRMNGGDGAFLGINEKNGNAIGSLHREKQVGTICRAGVTLARLRGRGAEKMDRVGMNLLERCERESFRAEGGLQKAAILGDFLACVPFHESKIQNMLAVEQADAAGPCAESVDEPGKFAQRRDLKDLQTAGTVQHPGRRK